MQKWYKVNGKNQKLTDEQAANLKELGLTVEPAKPEISKKRTAFERFLAPKYENGFIYLVAIDSKSLTYSSSVAASKMELYAILQDQIENGADEFIIPSISFMEKIQGGQIVYIMKLIRNDENVFEWVPSYEIEGLVYPSEETTETENS